LLAEKKTWQKKILCFQSTAALPKDSIDTARRNDKKRIHVQQMHRADTSGSPLPSPGWDAADDTAEYVRLP